MMDEKIGGALARGYYTKRNEKKTLDPDLIEDMSAEVEKVSLNKDVVEAETCFRLQLESLINKFSMENGSDTPDFILARYLEDCLKAFDKAVNRRNDWYNPKAINGRYGEIP